MSAPSTSRLLDTDDIAERFGTTRETVYKLVSENGLPAHRIRRRLLFDPDEVDAWTRGQDSSRDTERAAATQPAAPEVSASDTWVAEQVSKFGPDDLRRAAVLLTSLADAAESAQSGRE